MDIEKSRIPVTTPGGKLPFQPLKGVLFVRDTKYSTDKRPKCCTTGWALSVLGVPDTLLASTDRHVDVIRKHKNMSSYDPTPQGIAFLDRVQSLNDAGHVKKALAELKAGVANNRYTLEGLFGRANVTTLASKVDQALTAFDSPRGRR